MIALLLSLLAGWVMTTYDQYSALAGVGVRRATAKNLSVGTGVTTNFDCLTLNWDILTVNADLTATAAGDLGIAVFAYGPTGVLSTTPLTAVAGVGYAPTLAGGHSTAIQQYNVQGIEKVQVQLKNNNAGTQTLNATCRTEDI